MEDSAVRQLSLKRHRLKQARLPFCRDRKSHYYLRLYRREWRDGGGENGGKGGGGEGSGEREEGEEAEKKNGINEVENECED